MESAVRQSPHAYDSSSDHSKQVAGHAVTIRLEWVQELLGEQAFKASLMYKALGSGSGVHICVEAQEVLVTAA